MLRIEFQDAAPPPTLRLEGRLVGTFAEEVRKIVARFKVDHGLLVNMSEVTFVDTVGEEVLAWLGGMGAEFVAESSYSQDVCERLHLLLV